ncbi:hypothetical protein [Thermoactinomyces sp. DSM 45892]|uniref:hypothetical protein n=1 Tax=Thermoactinomyces sp. DSM 45892 TaxID=1882753 RepID=UPI000897B2F1|nr:hypothetical protein [Thermoactinomyces sp. DSM 45892]SDY88675.1 hypothetical protein SAMN05444416_109173 [Thermoactinomyces sp. DSM 45892]
MSEKFNLVVAELPLVITVSEGFIEMPIIPDKAKYLFVDYDHLLHEEDEGIIEDEMNGFEIGIRFQKSVFALIEIVKKQKPSYGYDFVIEEKGSSLIPITSNYQEVPTIVLEKVMQLVNSEKKERQ